MPDDRMSDDNVPDDRMPAEAAAEAAPAPERPAASGRAKRAALVGLRLASGVIGVAVAAATVAAVGLLPLPAVGITPPAVEVTPAPADQLRVCAGTALRLGDETGQNADVPQALDVASVRADAVGTTLDQSPIAASDAGTGGTAAAPQVLSVAPADGAALSGAQSQEVSTAGFDGFAAASCAEPTSSVWLTGGATTVGRTTLVMLSNPTAVAATVSLEIFGEGGAIAAPGMSGIDVPAGTQRVLSLAGFAPGLVSPVVHVTARGGQVSAYLQQSIVRGLDATGMDIVGGATEPATALTIPGVRIFDGVGTNRALSLSDWEDVAPVVRIAAPGAEDATVTVNVTPLDPAVEGTSFETTVSAGEVDELPLDAGAHTDGEGLALADGLYTVTLESDQPIVAGVRVSTAVDTGEPVADAPVEIPASDVAWYAAASPLDGAALLTVAPGPDPQIVVVNPSPAELTVQLDAQGGTDIELVVPAGGSAAAPADESTSYLVSDADGAFLAVSYAGDGAMAAYTIASARPVSGPIVIRP